jgi:hypothetical protein
MRVSCLCQSRLRRLRLRSRYCSARCCSASDNGNVATWQRGLPRVPKPAHLTQGPFPRLPPHAVSGATAVALAGTPAGPGAQALVRSRPAPWAAARAPPRPCGRAVAVPPLPVSTCDALLCTVSRIALLCAGCWNLYGLRMSTAIVRTRAASRQAHQQRQQHPTTATDRQQRLHKRQQPLRCSLAGRTSSWGRPQQRRSEGRAARAKDRPASISSCPRPSARAPPPSPEDTWVLTQRTGHTMRLLGCQAGAQQVRRRPLQKARPAARAVAQGCPLAAAPRAPPSQVLWPRTE